MTERFYKRIISIITFAFFCNLSGLGQTMPVDDRYPLIPLPSSLIPAEGYFNVNNQTKIVLQNIAFKNEANLLIQLIKDINGNSLQFSSEPCENCIVIMQDPGNQSPEGYHLSITSQKLVLSASSSAGIFWGIETIRQLLPAVVQPGEVSILSIPAADITDRPKFSWRGMHLDLARHFFSQAYLEVFLDRMALYKFNKLHLHLSDDQGWRIEIKNYPELVKKSAWRVFNGDDSECMFRSKTNPDFIIDSQHIITKDGRTLYGGYYTQLQMKEIIKYAADRHIDIIPEIDMPGHMMAAINAYPFLSSSYKSKNDFSTPICPCNEATFSFAENVFKEIMDLFPGPYIHLGGDEVSKTSWAKSPECKHFLKQEGLKSVDELQSYFVKRMEKFFREHGKRLVGWDNILDGGIDSTPIIMYWRSWVPNIPQKIALNGNDIIINPINPYYFDQIIDRSTLYNTYHFNPIPAELTDSQKNQIIGEQGDLWTETIPSEKRADYMTMPRMTVLSEIAWTIHPDYTSYLERLKSHYIRWDKMHIHYRLPDLEGFTENNVFTDSTQLIIQKPLPNLSVHYTINGSIPDLQSPVLSKPLTINRSANIKLAAFTPEGNKGDIYDLNYEKESFMPAVKARKTLQYGLRCIFHTGYFKTMKKMTKSHITAIYILNGVSVPADIRASQFGLEYEGYIDIPQNAIYSFYLTSDNGSILNIDNKTVVDNSGFHSTREKSGSIALQMGLHRFILNFIEPGGVYYSLRLQCGRQGDRPKNIPFDMFKYEK